MGDPHIPDIAKLAEDLKKATVIFEQASHRAATAWATETAALNDLNAAQKALDTAVAKMRESAPRNSEWQRHGRMKDADHV